MRVFLSYRRADVGGYAGRLHDALADRLGSRNVFQDVTAIAPGEDFGVVIDRALDDCDAALAVIGPGWLSARTEQGAARLLEPDDFVRQELTRALARNVPVVPVLVGRAPLPATEDLPTDLRGLARRQAVVLHDETWHEDVDGLVRSLRGDARQPRRKTRRWFVAAAALALIAVVVVAVALRGGGDSPSGRPAFAGLSSPSEGDKPACETPTDRGWKAIELTGDVTGNARAEDGVLEFTVTDAHWRSLEDGTSKVVLDVAMKNVTNQDRQIGSWFFSLVASQREFNEIQCASTAQSAFVKPNRVGDARFGWIVGCQPTGALDLVVSDPDYPRGYDDTINLAAAESSNC